jgi:acyl-CoA synthetase (AMP-forming)/AMP-acid ligase II
VAIFYTSGTTGISKGVVLPHNHHYVFGMDIVRHGRITDQDRFYSYLPYYHGLAQFMATVPALLAEGSVVIAERFSASHFMEEIRKYGATLCWAVPAIASILMKQPSDPEDGDNPLRIFFTAGIDPEIEEAFEKRFGVRVLQAYGSTEQGPLTWVSYEKPKEAYGTAGRVNERFYEVKIVDEADRELAPEKTGEIVSRNKEPYTRMIEYWDMPRATLDAFRNLWLHSGELGFVDDAGWLHFVGRKKDAIRRRGEFISAFELESAMARHPGVMECAAFPIPSELGEDEIKVVIVARPGVRLEPAELVAFCEAHVARYMVPRYLELVDARRELRRSVKELGLRGLKLDGTKQDFCPSDRMVYPLYGQCVEFNIPITFHCGRSPGYPIKYGNPEYLDRVALDFPELRINIGHFAWPWHDLCMAIAWDRPNVYFDIGGWRPKYIPPSVLQLTNSVVQDKALFSHDYPVVSTELLMREFAELNLRPEVKKKMQEINPRRFLEG